MAHICVRWSASIKGHFFAIHIFLIEKDLAVARRYGIWLVADGIDATDCEKFQGFSRGICQVAVSGGLVQWPQPINQIECYIFWHKFSVVNNFEQCHWQSHRYFTGFFLEQVLNSDLCFLHDRTQVYLERYFIWLFPNAFCIPYASDSSKISPAGPTASLVRLLLPVSAPSTLRGFTCTFALVHFFCIFPGYSPVFQMDGFCICHRTQIRLVA